MNSLDFKHFKLHADGTLKSMTKDKLISYIHMLHSNWKVTDEQLWNVIEYNHKIDMALDKACEELEGFCQTYEHRGFQEPFTKEEWKEWCLEDDD